MVNASKCFIALFIFTYATVVVSDEDEIFEMSLSDILDIDITTASRSAESASTAPGTVVAIPSAIINERGYRNLSDVLRDLPGVDLHQASASTSYNNVSIRGVFSNSKFVIMQNGIRISSPTGEDIPIADNFPLYNVKQIEVIYGPASALYGADAFTGVINIITYTDADEAKEHVALSVGQNSFRYGNALAAVEFSENSSLIVGFHRHDSDNGDLANDYPDRYFPLNDLVTFGGDTIVTAANRSAPEFPTESFSGYASLKLSENFRFGLNISSFTHTTATSTPPDAVDYGRDPLWKTDIETIHASYGNQLTESIRTDIQMSYSRYEIDPESKFANIFVAFADGYKYARGTKTDINQQFHYNYDDQNNVIVGYTIERLNSLPKTADLTQPFNPDLPATDQGLLYPFNTDLPVKIFEIDWTNYGVFAQWKSNWTESFSSTIGFRYDDSTTYGNTFNPRLGLVWQSEFDTTVKLLYGEAFLAPTPRFTHDHFGSFAFQDNDGVYQSFFMQVPNTDIEPEEMEMLELNISQKIGDSISVTAAIYQADVSNIIDRTISATPQSDFIPGGNIVTTQIFDNLGQIESEGIDLSLIYTAKLGPGNIKVFGSYSYVDGAYEENDFPLPFTASHKYKFNITYRQENWFITPSIYWIDESYNGDIPQPDLVPDYTVVNLYAGIEKIVDSFSVYLRVDNLLDEKYFTTGGGGSSTFAESPQDLRTAMLTVKYSF